MQVLTGSVFATDANVKSISGDGVKVEFQAGTITLYRLNGSDVIQMSKPSTMGYPIINGEPLQESYGKEVIRDPGSAKDPITLKDGEYFVLGDNRNNSSDSRDPSVGIIKRSDIVGRAFMRLYPFDRIGFLHKNA